MKIHQHLKPLAKDNQFTIKVEVTFEQFYKSHSASFQVPREHFEAVWDFYQNQEAEMGCPVTIDENEMSGWVFTKTLREYLPEDYIWHTTEENPLGLAPETEAEAFKVLQHLDKHPMRNKIVIISLYDGGYLIRE
jgi:hypothetical protein